jgi:putative nucleotidyltransferase with HDIG domain
VRLFKVRTRKSGHDQSKRNGENKGVWAFEQLQHIGNRIAKLPPHDIDGSHSFSNLYPAGSDIFSFPTDVLWRIFADSSGKTWRKILDSLYTRYGWVYEHSVNVALISVMIAVELKLDKKDLYSLTLGGLLHDVGKLLVPMTIIQKNSGLSDAEMNLVKKHSELGMSLVAGCSLSSDCMAVIMQHHERLDGSGYPYGLKGNDIHPLAKIAMIADVLDAITSYRPYRPARSIGEAISLIKHEGDKFSSELVAVMEKLHCSLTK